MTNWFTTVTGSPDRYYSFDPFTNDSWETLIPDMAAQIISLYHQENPTSDDANHNDVPDECDPDCNDNQTPDDLDIAQGASQDSNNNGVPDECDPGACCFGCASEPDSHCIDGLNEAECLATSGIFAGLDTSCSTSPCDGLCQTDFNGDNLADVFDFGVFAAKFGHPASAGRLDGDFDCDGDVDVFDFGVMGAMFGCGQSME